MGVKKPTPAVASDHSIPQPCDPGPNPSPDPNPNPHPKPRAQSGGPGGVTNPNPNSNPNSLGQLEPHAPRDADCGTLCSVPAGQGGWASEGVEGDTPGMVEKAGLASPTLPDPDPTLTPNPMNLLDSPNPQAPTVSEPVSHTGGTLRDPITPITPTSRPRRSGGRPNPPTSRDDPDPDPPRPSLGAQGQPTAPLLSPPCTDPQCMCVDPMEPSSPSSEGVNTSRPSFPRISDPNPDPKHHVVADSGAT